MTTTAKNNKSFIAGILNAAPPSICCITPVLAFLGGATPYISAKLIQFTNLPWAPAFYLCLVSLLGFTSVIVVMNSKQKFWSSDLNTEVSAAFLKKEGLQYG